MDSSSACFDYVAECYELADTLASEVKQAKAIINFQAEKLNTMKQDSAAQAAVNYEYVGQIKLADSKIEKLVNKQRSTAIILYVVTALAAAFAITTFVK